MKRLLVLAALAICTACGDDDPGTELQETSIAGEDASAALPALFNVGEACDHDLACEGPRAECLTRSSTSSFYSGGYCTAACVRDADCGSNGICPVSEAEQAEPTYDFANSWPRICFLGCTPGPVNGCRVGYRCMSLAEAYARPLAPAPMKRPVCIPIS